MSRRIAACMKDRMNYKETLLLPQTSFPMKGNLPQNEPKRLAQWQTDDLYGQIRAKSAGRPRFILHDGPPYANGHLHMGHTLNKVLKDLIVKSRTMAGFDAPYVPGWDCHGLPIEHMVLKKLGSKRHQMSQNEVRAACRTHADRFVGIQRDEFARLGVFGDWQQPYLTMDPTYEGDTLRQLASFADSGALYKGKKPVHWCPSCETALAEAEVEHADVTSPTVYVRFPLMADAQLALGVPAGTAVAIWTTTPWTLPANRAVCINANLIYQLLPLPDGPVVVAEGLVEAICATLDVPVPEDDDKVLVPAEALAKAWVQHPFLGISVPVICGDHVTLEAGTGVVHTAPGHGQDDYEVGLAHDLEVFAPVDSRGRFTAEVGVPQWEGLKVKEANPLIVEHLAERGMLLHSQPIEHSYPHCWRCKGAVIFRATAQWFISMAENDLQSRALDAIEQTEWIPKWGRERIRGMVETRPDWCISRQRVWGVPIIAMACNACEHAQTDGDWIRSLADRADREGVDFWFGDEATSLLPDGATCESCGSSDMVPERHILDVWFDSGVSHAAVLKRRDELSWPADLYLEGSDQHRGWFQSSLLVGVGVDGEAPYKAVLTHGFLVDAKGLKMSKSTGNGVEPDKLIKRVGAEILRLWVAAEDYRDDIKFSEEILSHLVETYRKIRNTSRFMLASLGDYDPATHGLDQVNLSELDRWALDRLHRLIGQVEKSYEEYSFHQVVHAINRFCVVDLSTFYLDITKDRVYCDSASADGRKASQAVMYEIVTSLTRLMAPVLTFTAEEIWQHMPEGWSRAASVHLTDFPKADARWIDDELASRWERLRKVRAEGTRVLEEARREKQIRQSLEAHITLYVDDDLRGFLTDYEVDLADLFITSGAALLPLSDAPAEAVAAEEVTGLKVRVVAASGDKCERCWMYRADVGSDGAHPTVCTRCAQVVAQLAEATA